MFTLTEVAHPVHQTSKEYIFFIPGLDNAYEWKELTNDKLKPQLTEAIARYKPVKKLHDSNENVLSDVEKILENIAVTDLGKVYTDATENADGASKSIGEVDYAINTTFVEVSERVRENSHLESLIFYKLSVAEGNERSPFFS